MMMKNLLIPLLQIKFGSSPNKKQYKKLAPTYLL